VPKNHIDHHSWDKMACMKIICLKLISSSYGLSYICKNNNDLPTQASVFIWLSDEERNGGDTPLLDIYTRAKELQADYMVDEMQEIADNGTNDWMKKKGSNGEEYEVVNKEHINRSRLRIETRKWTAAKLKHRKYGDKLEISGDPKRPLSSSTDEELKEQIAILTKKMNDES